MLTSPDGWSCLQAASYRGQLEVVKALLAGGSAGAPHADIARWGSLHPGDLLSESSFGGVKTPFSEGQHQGLQVVLVLPWSIIRCLFSRSRLIWDTAPVARGTENPHVKLVLGALCDYSIDHR